MDTLRAVKIDDLRVSYFDVEHVLVIKCVRIKILIYSFEIIGFS